MLFKYEKTTKPDAATPVISVFIHPEIIKELTHCDTSVFYSTGTMALYAREFGGGWIKIFKV